MEYDLAEMIRKASLVPPDRFIMQILENAVLAERERCAKIAEDTHADYVDDLGPLIAEAIRNPKG